MSDTITCPNCQHEIQISEVMSAQLATRIRADLEAQLQPQRQALETQAAAIKSQKAEIEKTRTQLEDEVSKRVEEQRKTLLIQTRAKIEQEVAVELKDRDEQIAEFESKLKKARDEELELRRRERELKQQAEEMELKVARQIDEERERIRIDAAKKAAEDNDLKQAEKDKQINDLRKQIDALKQKAEQGSQQTQGEVLEIALEELLKQTFPSDHIGEVPKGIRGGDVVQQVHTPSGVDCGMILWETKRTKTFSNGWLAKLRQDQRDAQASVSILVTTVLPEGVDHFGQLEGVWVCSWPCVASLASALRAGLLEVAKARVALQGQQGKMEHVYSYLASPQFKNRVAGIVDAFVAMKEDLEKEKRAIQKQWSKREKQIEQAMIGTAGMYGDFQGIIGSTLPEIEAMSLLQLEAKEPQTKE